VRQQHRDWLVFSDLHILFVAAAWMQGNSALFAYTLPASFLMVASVGAFLVYRVDRLLLESPEDALNTPERLAFSRRYRLVLLASAAGLMVMAVGLALTMRVLWLEMVLVVGIAGLVYPLRILPGGRRPKDIAWLKTALVACGWVGGGVLLPLVLFSGGESLAVGVAVVAYRVLWIMPNLSASDWMDRAGDQAAGSGNLVASWSVRKAQRVLWLGLLAAGLLASFLTFSGLPPGWLAMDFAGMAILSWAAWRVIRRHESEVVSAEKPHAAHIVVLDVLVAWPLLTWILM